MNPRDHARAAAIEAALVAHSVHRRRLPGIEDANAREVFVQQMIDSLHRVAFPTLIARRSVLARRADPAGEEYFDPIRGAAFHMGKGHFDEACWLIFLFVQFGKHSRGGYRYARDVYWRLGQGGRWDWPAISANPSDFVAWLSNNAGKIKAAGPGGFGNHRKYESLAPEITGSTVTSYVAWVNPARGHMKLIDEAVEVANGDPGRAFDLLFKSMRAVRRFGRTARFDYLTMLGKLKIAPIEPGSAYLAGATGPRAGAMMLYGAPNGTSARIIETWLRELGDDLHVGQQVIEDALCNWQKSPQRYRRFRG